MPPVEVLRRSSTPRPLAAPVVETLLQHGVDPVPQPGEGREAHENRVSTAMMALFRDTRDSQVFEALHAFAGPGVLAWIKSLLGREPAGLDPHEILQDTFVNVYRYPAAFREDHGGSFRVWVRTIAGNVVRRCALARARTLRHEAEAPLELEDRSVSPAESVLRQDEAEGLRRAWILLLHFYAEAWKELGQRDRRTLHLVEVEGLSYQEAGRILSVGRSNMKMIVFRSRRRLARRMRAAMTRCLESSPDLVA